MKKINWLERRRLLKKEKKELIDTIKDLGSKLSAEISQAVSKAEELEQHKLYYIVVEDTNEKELLEMKRVLGLVKKAMKWTMPNIIFINKPIKELSKETLTDLLDQQKKLEPEVKN